MHESGTRKAGRGGGLKVPVVHVPHHCQPFSYHFQHARAAARPFMHRYVIFSQNAPSSQPAMRALAGWPIACIHPASQPRACIMHEDSGCTQIRSWMAGWMDGWMDACARARARMHPASQPRARIHYACRVWMHSDQIMHCMHAEPRGSQITGRYMHAVWAVNAP